LSVERDLGDGVLASSAIYVAIGVAIVLLGSVTKRVVIDKQVDVTFVEKNHQGSASPPPRRRSRLRR